MNKDLIKNLQDKGFTNIYEWTDEPNTEYPEHSHKGRVSFYLTKGDIQMNIGGTIKIIKAGEHIDVPVGVPHTAKVGPNGCTFIVGEEIKGDS